MGVSDSLRVVELNVIPVGNDRPSLLSEYVVSPVPPVAAASRYGGLIATPERKLGTLPPLIRTGGFTMMRNRMDLT